MSTPAHYKSLVTGEVIPVEELIECENCDGDGGASLYRGACPTCGGTGKLGGYGIPPGDNYAPRRVVAVGDPLMEESQS